MKVKSISNPYINADKTLINRIESCRKSKNGILDNYWQVGKMICTRNEKGYYHCYGLVKSKTEGFIIKDYRINKKGEIIDTLYFYKVPTIEEFNKWCSERNFIYDTTKR